MQHVLMICAHEPSLDPRIRWEAEAAARRFQVTVLGFNRDDRSLPPVERINGYEIIRLNHGAVSGLYYFWRLKDVIPKEIRLALGALLLLGSPLLVLAEVILRLARGAVRWLLRASSRLVTMSLLLKAIKLSPLLGFARGRLMARVEYILAVLRVQFAAATSLFWNHIDAMPHKPDVVHCNDLDTLLVGVLAKQRYGCRVVYDAHEFYPVSDPHGKWLDVTFFSWLERLLIRRADAVVTVNPMLGEAMRAAYTLDRVYSVPNAEPWSDEHRAPARGEMERLANGRVKFLFQGRFTPGRGIDELIEGWAAVDGQRAALFLRGPDNMWREAAVAKAAQLGLLDRSVYFLDAVSEDELVMAAAEADVGVIPYKPLIINDRLSCPNKLSQYLHAGLMVLANDLPYVKSVLSEAGAGIFYNSADLNTLATAARQILDDPELRRRGRENARRFARERFNWQVQGEVLLTLYQGSDGVQPAIAMPAPSASHMPAA
ncbi:MAG TPA: glycosyltransferase [Stellaceae bacterium]|nr:glycosyltransferase [Stellaceae bacterium]